MRLFYIVERMDEYRMAVAMARMMLMAEAVEVYLTSVWRIPRLGWMNGVKVALSSRGMTKEAA